MEFAIPEQLAANCREKPAHAWLARLPGVLSELSAHWRLSLAAPFEGQEVSCSWVSPAILADGTEAILKIGMPHMEAEHEAEGLRFWNGEPTARLLAHDPQTGAMLLERCYPGTALRALPEPEQDAVLAALLRRLWRRPSAPHPFRPLSAMLQSWADETRDQNAFWPDRGLVRAGLDLFIELARSTPADVLLATDLHAGNILRAEREPWLVIDPKPFVGDPAYDVTQHLFNCLPRVLADPQAALERTARLAGVDAGRVRLWMFARAAAEPRANWCEDSGFALARLLVPN